jgi:hypothetical protein
MLQLTGEDAEIDSKMEFLDINLTKDWCLLLLAIHSPPPSTGGFGRKAYFSLV